MKSLRTPILVLLSVSLVLGCSSRKSKEEFPDEFAQGLEYHEENRADFAEMEDSKFDPSQDDGRTGLIAAGDLKTPVRDDTVPSLSKSREQSQSIWDGSTDLNDLETVPVDAADSSISSGSLFDFDSTADKPAPQPQGGGVVGAPIAGGVVPPPRANSSTAGSSPPAQAPPQHSRLDRVDGGAQSPGSGLNFNDPPRVLADAGFGAENPTPPFRSPGSLLLEPTRPSAMPNELDLRSPDVPDRGFDFAGATGAGRENGGLRAAQAIGGAGTIGGAAVSPFGNDSSGSNPAAPGPATNLPQPTRSPQPGADASVRARDDLPDARTLMQEGIRLYRDEKNFPAAISTFRDYLSAYDENEEAVRAYLAYALMQDRRYGEASKEFNILLNSRNPEVRADAQYYLGSIYEKQGDFETARIRWEHVIEEYSDTEAAEKARKSLGRSTP